LSKQRAFAEKLPLGKQGNDRFFALLGGYDDFNLSLQYLEDSVSLGVNDPFGLILNLCPAVTHGCDQSAVAELKG